MSRKRHNYIRSLRKRANLTQDELAYLLGSAAGSNVSEIELRKRGPNAHAVFALQVVFRVPAHEMFPGLYAAVEQPVLERAQNLLEELSKPNNEFKDNKHKEAFLAAIISQEEAHQRDELWENKNNLRFYLP